MCLIIQRTRVSFLSPFVYTIYDKYFNLPNYSIFIFRTYPQVIHIIFFIYMFFYIYVYFYICFYIYMYFFIYILLYKIN